MNLSKLLALLVFLTTFCLLPTTIHAQAEFITKAAVTYEVLGDDTTHVTHDISIENVFTTIFTPTYTLKLTGVNPINVKAPMGGQELPVTVHKSSDIAATKIIN